MPEYTVTGGANPFALSFDGVNDYVQSNSPIAAHPFTLEAWVEFSDLSVPSTIISLNTSINQYFALAFDSATGKISAVARNTTSVPLNGVTNVVANTWYHVAAVFNSATDRKLYVNGLLEGSNVTNVPFIIPTQTLIGLVRTSSPTNYMKGNIDDVRIWNVARTQAEIQADMNRQLAGNESGLVGYWKFSEGSGTTANDSAGSNHGTISGATYTANTPELSYVIEVTETWVSTDKINYGDFNRIEKNIKLTRDYLTGLTYAIPSITIVNTRDNTYIDYLSSINRLETNLETIRTNFVTPSGYPGTQVWVVGDGFDYTDANRLEEDIRLLFQAGENAYESFKYCGTFYCGEEGLIY